MAHARTIGALLWLLAAGCSDGPGAGPGERRPNVVVVTLDTTRADRIGCYGHAGAHTLHVDQLAARGARFERAYAPVPLTLPSHATLLTGLQPPEHGLHDNGRAALPGDVPTLAHSLRSAGWATGAFVSSAVLDSTFGLARGFDAYDDRMSAVDERGEAEPPQRDGAATTDAALAWLAGAREPFALWLHLYDPHATYEPPAAWRARVADPYDGEIAYADEQIGRVLAALRARGALERTLVVVTSDHGESLGEHGEKTHGIFVYDASLRIPLVLAGPGVRPVVAGAPVELADVAPTLLALCGLPAIGGGRDLAPALRGQPLAARAIYGECESAWLAFGWSPLHTVVHDGWRYVHSSAPELYDLARDPREVHDLAATEASRAAVLRAELERLRAGFQQRASAAAQVDEELAARISSLGYAQSTAPSGPGADLSALRAPRAMAQVLDDFNTGVGFAQHGQPDRAIALLERAAQAWPQGAQIRQQLGMAYHQAGRHADARRELQAALALDRSLEQAHYFLGLAAAAEAQYEDAVTAFDRALKLRPSSHLALSAKAWALVRLDRREDAAACLRRVVELKPGHLQYALGLARLLRELGRPAESTAVLLAAHATRPDDDGLALLLAWDLATNPETSARDGKRAVALAERALAQRGQRAPDDLDTLAAAYAEVGRFDAAVQALDEALRAPGSDPALTAEWQARRGLYLQRKPFRDG